MYTCITLVELTGSQFLILNNHLPVKLPL